MIAHVQALRFFAAFWVVLYHVRSPLVPAEFMPALGPVFKAFAGMGFVGVDLFFVISGAVMAESTRGAPPGAGGWRFAARRFSRVYAGWWPFFVLYLLANHWTRGLAGRDLLGSFWLLPLPHEKYLVSIIWTLSFELYFYALLAALLFLPRARLRLALGAWAALALGLAAWQVANGRYAPEHFHQVGLLESFFLSPYVAEFAAGFLLCDSLRGRPAPGRRAWWPWLAGGAVLFAAGAAYEAFGALQVAGLAGWFHTPERVLLLGGAACGVVGAALLAPTPRWRLHARLARLGDASYSLYLCHILVLGTAYHVLARLGVGKQFPVVTLLVVLASVVAYSWLHHRWVEWPLYRRASRLTLTDSARLRPSLL